MKKLICPVFCFWVLFSCQSYLLDKEAMNALNFPDSRENLLIYHNQEVSIEENSRMFVKAHKIIKTGSNLAACPELLYVENNSIEKLIHFEAKIHHSDGSAKKYGLNQLYTQRISNSYRISDDEVKLIQIADEVKTGDKIELIYIHEITLPQLGVIFSPEDIGADGYNISFSIKSPISDSVFCLLVNDTIKPDIISDGKNRIYKFSWDIFKTGRSKQLFEFDNKAPVILCSGLGKMAGNRFPGWKDFGNWYLSLIAPRLTSTQEIKALAMQITVGKVSDLEKMDTIFQYVQSNIRYEQVYLEKGGFIPNEPRLIFANKFGDCKDYSTLIYVMAKSVGLSPEFALCYRGRGIEFFEKIPVSQFNHMIVHFESEGKDYWYDGTNRTGLPGLTTNDLINQAALFIRRDGSEIRTIKESQENNIHIAGTCRQNKKDLSADLKIVLTAQYAIDLFFYDFYMNKGDMSDLIIKWFKKNVSNKILISHLHWDKNKESFTIELKAEIPNSVTILNENYYISLSSIFDRLLPEVNIDLNKPEPIDYYPGYGRITVDLSFPDFYEADSDSHQTKVFSLNFKSSLPPGPFTGSEKEAFAGAFIDAQKLYKLKYKLKTRESL